MKRISFAIAVFLLLPVAAKAATNSVESPVGKRLDGFSLPDWHGNPHTLDELKDSQLVVVAFLGTECPLAKVYAPRLVALADEFKQRGVAFVAVDSNLQDSISELGVFAKAYGLTFPVLKDLNNELADKLGAQRTPEVFLLDRERVVRYCGRIDDQYGFQTGAGYAKPRVNRRDLAEAINEVLDGKTVSQPAVKPEGCLIGRVKKTDPQGDITYSKQIARILQNRCVDCHRPGEVAPFSLTSYDEVVGWAEMIREVVDEGRMPPWFANPEHGHFANDARMSDDEKQTIAAWLKNGCPQGDASDLPVAKNYVEGWQIGQPDQIVYMNDEGYDVPAEGVVEYKYFTVDPNWKEDRWVQATECRPGDRSVVHHIIVFVQSEGGRQSEFGNRGGLGGYAPGSVAHIAPPGTAIHVPAGSKLVFQMHYTPNGVARKDRSSIGIKFADVSTVKRRMKGGVVGNVSFVIPPEADNHEVQAKRRFSTDTLLLSLTPHMHLRGKSFRYELEYPDGHREVLLDVPRWDFNWQIRYTFSEPKLVPQGSRLHVVAHFDNSADNLANPDPQSEVRFGDQTWEEMMFGFYSSVDPNEDITLAKGTSDEQPSESADKGGE